MTPGRFIGGPKDGDDGFGVSEAFVSYVYRDLQSNGSWALYEWDRDREVWSFIGCVGESRPVYDEFGQHVDFDHH